MPVPLTRAAGGNTATPLPDPYPGLASSRYRVKFRRSQLVMLAGPPGAGKTTLALVAALRMGVPTLYISADSDQATMAARAAAAITKQPVKVAEGALYDGTFSSVYAPQMGQIPMRLVYDPSEPSMGDLADSLTAWLEVQGENPHLIVVDNLMNIRGEDGNEWTAMRQTCKDLHWLARHSKACVMVLHHTSEQDSAYILKAPPRTAIQGKVAQLPSLILTTAHNQGLSMVAVVKHRHGPADPMANDPLRWTVDFNTCQIDDQPLQGSVINAHNYNQEEDDFGESFF